MNILLIDFFLVTGKKNIYCHSVEYYHSAGIKVISFFIILTTCFRTSAVGAAYIEGPWLGGRIKWMNVLRLKKNVT